MDAMLNMGMGVPMEMLPPGEQYRRQFDRSLMGLEMMSGGGGDDGDDAADAQYEQNVDQKNYDDRQLQRKHDHTIDLIRLNGTS